MPAISANTSSARPSVSSRVAAPSGTASAPPIATSGSSATSVAAGGISTVYATATVTVSAPYGTPSVTQNSRGGSTLPAGIVAGAVAGSVALAVALVLAWTYWSKKMKEHKRRQHFTTLAAQNGPLWQKPHAYRRTTSGSSTDSEIGINNGAEASEKVDTLGSPSSSAHHTPSMTECKPKKPSRRTLQKNRKAREHARQKSLLCPILDVDNENIEPTPPTPSTFSEAPPRYSSPAIQYPSNIIRKASTVGSASIYSTQSGEERHMSADADLLKAALGMPGLTAAASISHKLSNVSSAYSSQSGEDRQFSMISHMPHPSQRRLTGWTPSLGSMYSAAEDQQQPSTSGGPRLGQKGAVGTLSRLSQFSFHDPNDVGMARGGGEAL